MYTPIQFKCNVQLTPNYTVNPGINTFWRLTRWGEWIKLYHTSCLVIFWYNYVGKADKWDASGCLDIVIAHFLTKTVFTLWINFPNTSWALASFLNLTRLKESFKRMNLLWVISLSTIWTGLFTGLTATGRMYNTDSAFSPDGSETEPETESLHKHAGLLPVSNCSRVHEFIPETVKQIGNTGFDKESVNFKKILKRVLSNNNIVVCNNTE